MIGTQRLRNSKRSSSSCLRARLSRSSGALPFRLFTVRGAYATTIRESADNSEIIQVPAGTHNLRVLFRRGTDIASAVRILSPGVIGFSVGSANVSPDDSGQIISGPVSPGQDSLTLAPGQTAPDEGYYFLRDIDKEENAVPRPIGGELVYVTGVSGSTINLRDPITQPYEGSGIRLTTPPVPVCRNISIRGLRCKGVQSAGFDAWLAAGWVDGLSVRNCQGRDALDGGFSIRYSRDIHVSWCNGCNMPKPTDPFLPWGYTFQFIRSVELTIDSCAAKNSQYVTTMESGCASFRASNLSGYDLESSFDIHGGDSYGGTCINVGVANMPLSIGNTTHRRGASQVAVSDTTCGNVRVVMAIRDCTFTNLKCSAFLFETGTKDPNPGALDAVPIGVSISDSTITAVDVDSQACVNFSPFSSTQPMFFSDISFTNCVMTQEETDGVIVRIANATSPSILVLNSCTMTLSPSSPYWALVLGGTSPTNLVEVNCESCEFIQPNVTKVGRASNASFATFVNVGGNFRGPSDPPTTALSASDFTNVNFV